MTTASTASKTPVLALALVFVACSPAPDKDPAQSDDSYPVEVEILATPEVLSEVRDLEVSDEGRVWVLNSTDPILVGIDLRDGTVSSYGGLGGGPEEFRAPAGFVSGPLLGAVWVLDRARFGFVRVSGTDGEWAELSIPVGEVGPAALAGGMHLTDSTVRTASLGDEVLIPRTSATMSDGLVAYRRAMLGADILGFNPNTGEVRSVLSLADQVQDPSRVFSRPKEGCPSGSASGRDASRKSGSTIES